MTTIAYELPTATYVIKDGIPHAYPEYDIINIHNQLDYVYLSLKLNETCQKLSTFIIIFYNNKMIPTESIDNKITEIHTDIHYIIDKIKIIKLITNEYKNGFNKIIVIFNQILTYYNNIKYNKIKITTKILLDFNNLNRQLLSLYKK